MAIFGLNFNPFKSAHGGETDASGKSTTRGKKDFFAPMFDFSNSLNSWKRVLNGDISWKDFVDPGSVINNPAQKPADSGEFFTGDKLTEGEFGKRGRASAALAAMIYGGIGAPGLSGSGTDSTAASTTATTEPTGAALAGPTGPGGASQLNEVAIQPWYERLLSNPFAQNLLDTMSGGRQEQTQAPVYSQGSSPGLNPEIMKRVMKRLLEGKGSSLTNYTLINPFS